MSTQTKNRKVAVVLAFASVLLPISGLQKFYLGQPSWGVLYLLLSFTPMGLVSRVASAVDGVWYLFQQQEEFDQNFNHGTLHGAAGQGTAGSSSGNRATQSANLPDPKQIGAIADSLRQLDQLRQDGLISEYEFEQKRRQLLDRIG
jgi:TM2 domain-containing membrane protein YozV